MKRLLIGLAITTACERAQTPSSRDSLAVSTIAIQAAPAPPIDTAPPSAAPASAADSGAVVGELPWSRYPRIERNTCEGEACSMAFPAIACGEVQLRTASHDTASLGPTVRKGDTVNVRQTDLHHESPGVVEMRRDYVIANDYYEEKRFPRKDTVRLSAGDTLFLVGYFSEAGWDVVHRGKLHRIDGGFWYADLELPRVRGESRMSDSSVAVARSFPQLSVWWHVAARDGRRGFWKFDSEKWRDQLKPDAKYWEQDCTGEASPT